ncbi:MAG: hypothetical protein JJU29_15135 [Verrucomicrobia bacterium]|nr:hypothetical protein [Verrucomicrobiota bacterium]MCH8512437.1 hypothetical protein [Kiritimatiellia bacterium]
MQTTLVMTVLGPDRPGIVEALSACVKSCEGNWLESRLAHLAGHFAGIVQISLPLEKRGEFEESVARLEAEECLQCHFSASDPVPSTGKVVSFDVVGQDRPGIVFALTDLLAEFNANVESLDTHCSSAPMSGEILFHAELRVALPEDIDLNALEARLADIGDELMLDVHHG